jgi:hypothetical protein
LPKGESRNRRLQFLSEAAKEFQYFKDGWRNYVSHGRGEYDDHLAQSVMQHVRQFMTILSRELYETVEEGSDQPPAQIGDQSRLHPAPERSQ